MRLPLRQLTGRNDKIKIMKNHFLISFGILVLLVDLGGAITTIPSWLRDGDMEKAYEAYIKSQTPDEYGGKTPQETLDLFVAALRKGDVELASKYFVPDDKGSREKWVSYLNSVKEKNLLTTMADDIATKAKPAGSSYEGSANFKILSSDGIVEIFPQLVFGGGIWKIENF